VFKDTSHSKKDLLLALQSQFPMSPFFKGQPTWNVPLESTLTSFPPQVHDNCLRRKQLLAPSKIDSLLPFEGTTFVATGSKEAGSIMVWNTDLRLQCASKFNVFQKYYDELWQSGES